MNVVDRSRAANPITKGKLANNIARALYAFFQVSSPNISSIMSVTSYAV